MASLFAPIAYKEHNQMRKCKENMNNAKMLKGIAEKKVKKDNKTKKKENKTENDKKKQLKVPHEGEKGTETQKMAVKR